VRDNSFAPASLTAAVAATVTWTWRGAAAHNVTFEDGQGSSNTQAAGSHSRAFAGPGTYRYRCTIHSTDFQSGMVGNVIVN
jgi:plastocyanin